MLPVKIEVITLGKLSREYSQIVGEYEKRISKLAHAKFVYGSKIPKDAIFLDPNGVEMSSEEFFQLIKEKSSKGEKIIFVVGPPEGFGEVQGKKISLSRMTFQHDLARLVLLEQIYRALLRMKGTNYEK